nr:MAG TPA: hypothetical protein [Caudoviricetes sp.]
MIFTRQSKISFTLPPSKSQDNRGGGERNYFA